MLCEKVVPLLSEYFDEALDPGTAIQVSQHLDQCPGCRKELSGIVRVHSKLRSMSSVQAPDYLRDLVQLRIVDMRKNRWRAQLQDALELRWSRIRTTEGIWYATKAMGTVLTAVLFFLIPCSINPINIEANSSIPERSTFSRVEKQQVALNVVAKLGMLSKEDKKGLAKPNQPAVKPAIHEQYVSNFGESISEDAKDYDFGVVTYVDRSGKGQALNVIEHPNAQTFLNSFNKVISAGRFAPGRRNGEAVPSTVILMFSKISVNSVKD
ncbi:MAG TPA: anti-sigma factor [Acidobacteriota bacterium]|nr:anti-sigma factor [Acidobacteriota bacterium]